MTTFIPAILALLGLGMFACSLWLQELEERSRNRREPVLITAPAALTPEVEIGAGALSHHPPANR